MIRTKVTLSLTKQGKNGLLQKLEDINYDKRPDKMFADAKSFLDSATTLAENNNCVVLEFEELAAGWAELDTLKAALVGLADEMHPYQALFEDEYGTQSDSYGEPQTYDIVLPGEHLDYDIFDKSFKEALKDEAKQADIALKEVFGEEGLDRHDMESLMLALADKRFEPIAIDAKEHECSAMGLISTRSAIALEFDYDDLKDFVSSILDDMNRESNDGLYEFCGLKLLMRR